MYKNICVHIYTVIYIFIYGYIHYHLFNRCAYWKTCFLFGLFPSNFSTNSAGVQRRFPPQSVEINNFSKKRKKSGKNFKMSQQGL